MLVKKIIRQVNHYIVSCTLLNTYVHFPLQYSTLKHITPRGPTLTKTFQIYVGVFFLWCLQKMCFQTNLSEPVPDTLWVLLSGITRCYNYYLLLITIIFSINIFPNDILLA